MNDCVPLIRSHTQTEGYSDKIRQQYKSMTGKDIPIKVRRPVSSLLLDVEYFVIVQRSGS